MMELSSIKWNSASDTTIIQALGAFIRHHRLQQNITQADLSKQANINRSTLSEFERGTRVNMITFVQLLRALDLLHVLETFSIHQQVSPLELAKKETKSTPRQRASKSDNVVEEPEVDW